MCYRNLILWSITIAFNVFTMNVIARPVTPEEVLRVAQELIAQPFLQETFPLCTIDTIEPMGELWRVNLFPRGHLLLSSSTKAMPLLSYSEHDYTPPPEGHPALVIESHLQAHVCAAEISNNISTFALVSNEQTDAEDAWERLLNPSPISLFATTSTTQISPLLTTTWDQWSPWNDFTPQYKAESQSTNNSYRGRMPLGCVATMSAQLMKYHQWPVRLDETFTNTLNVTNGILGSSYEMRLHGGLPINWSEFKNTYSWSSENEAYRLPIARLGLLAAILVDMQFSSNGSSAYTDRATSNTWYSTGRTISKSSSDAFSSEELTLIKTSLDNQCPLPTSIPGHAVVTDGYREDSTGTAYLHLNYGWSGDKDAFYAANNAQIQFCATNYMPHKQAQVEPLPNKTKNGDIVKWCIPPRWQNTFTGFKVNAKPYSATSLTTWSDPATSIADPLANNSVYQTTKTSYNGSTISAFNIKTNVTIQDHFYNFQEPFIPTENSTFSCVSTAYYTQNHTLDLQIWSENTPTWTTIHTFRSADTSSSAWRATSLSLKAYKDQFCKLRLRFNFKSGTYYYDCRYTVGNFKITNVYNSPATGVTTWNASASARQQTLSDLSEGYRYAISVQPKLSSGNAGTSYVFTTATTETITPPEIQSIKTTTGASLTNSRLNGDLDGTSTLRVTCNDAVTRIHAQSSCPTLLPDSAFTIYRYDSNVFDIVIRSPQTKTTLDGSRSIITVEAYNTHGDKTYKDVVLALRSSTASVSYTIPELSLNIATGKTLTIPHYWFRSFGLATTTTATASFTSIAQQDADQDGLLTWQEFLCNTSPVDATEKLKITSLEFNADGTLKQVHYTPQSAPLADFILEGKANLTDTNWAPYNTNAHQFFRVRAELK